MRLLKSRAVCSTILAIEISVFNSKITSAVLIEEDSIITVPSSYICSIVSDVILDEFFFLWIVISRAATRVRC